jgi:hypothetical protein
MNAISHELERLADRNLVRAIEPLASYICAADRPREALRSALAVLLDEVNANNRAAWSHCLRATRRS